ncbi:MAG: hypothetical protein IPK46_20980 [Saprospiraceae bacterium]|nr:hypothetical protein [Saprospiraceae bacterium]
MEIKQLNDNKTDRLVQVLNATFGEIPFVGGVFVQFISSVIPNQRTDRIVEFIRLLDEKLNKHEQEIFQSKILNEDFSGLFEDIIESALRSIGEERRQNLVEVFKAGLKSDKETINELRLVTKILKELNDVEVIILKSKSIRTTNEYHEFYQKHNSILDSQYLIVGASKEDEKRHYMYKGYMYHLVSLGLIVTQYEIKKIKIDLMIRVTFK